MQGSYYSKQQIPTDDRLPRDRTGGHSRAERVPIATLTSSSVTSTRVTRYPWASWEGVKINIRLIQCRAYCIKDWEGLRFKVITSFIKMPKST